MGLSLVFQELIEKLPFIVSARVNNHVMESIYCIKCNEKFLILQSIGMMQYLKSGEKGQSSIPADFPVDIFDP